MDRISNVGFSWFVQSNARSLWTYHQFMITWLIMWLFHHMTICVGVTSVPCLPYNFYLTCWIFAAVLLVDEHPTYTLKEFKIFPKILNWTFVFKKLWVILDEPTQKAFLKLKFLLFKNIFITIWPVFISRWLRTSDSWLMTNKIKLWWIFKKISQNIQIWLKWENGETKFYCYQNESFVNVNS